MLAGLLSTRKDAGGASDARDQNGGVDMGAQESHIHTNPRYGILGGTFDPPHWGHLVLAQEAYVRLHLDRVWFVPTGVPPHKSGRAISAAHHRVAMVGAAIDGDERFALSGVEVERAGPSYTAETLRLLRAQWGASAHLCLIVGWDMLASLPTWHDAPGVVAGTDQIGAAHRPGYAVDDADLAELEARLPGLRARLALVEAPQLDLAATSLRERVALGLPIRYLVPDAVAAYIARYTLYREAEQTVAPRHPSDPSDPSAEGGA